MAGSVAVLVVRGVIVGMGVAVAGNKVSEVGVGDRTDGKVGGMRSVSSGANMSAIIPKP